MGKKIAVAEADLHTFVMPMGKHKDERLVRVPVSYLRWMVASNHSLEAYAAAELARRGCAFPDLDVTSHAINRASLNCLDVWRKTRSADEGLHSWLTRVAQESMMHGENRGENRYQYLGMKFVIKQDGRWPVLVTVHPVNAGEQTPGNEENP